MRPRYTGSDRSAVAAGTVAAMVSVLIALLVYPIVPPLGPITLLVGVAAAGFFSAAAVASLLG
jgi:adenine/guanine phosphoribosyltransferase-like PRPP-binding protein